jgi:predicted negative regulator of RcsB-dependent stress response
MTQHISRRDLKKDEIREGLAQGATSVLAHQKDAAIFLGICVVVLGAVLGWRLYTEHQNSKATDAYANAMDAFNAHVRTAAEPVDPSELSFADDKSKFTEAAKRFVTVAQKYPRTKPGQMSAYFAGLSYEKLDNNNQAAEWLNREGKSSDADFSSLARLELAQLDDKMGKKAEAEQLLKDLIAKPTVFVSKPVAMLALADHYAQNNNNADASKMYTQIRTEFPDTNIAQEAGQHLELLGGSS